MGNVAPWIVKALAGVAIVFTVFVWLSVASSVVLWARVPSFFFAILAVWVLSIVLAVRNTPRVDSPSRVAYNFWRLMIVLTSAALLYLVLFPAFSRAKEANLTLTPDRSQTLASWSTLDCEVVARRNLASNSSVNSL